MLNMGIDERGLQLVEGYEGFRDTAYYDVAGILTIGYGHTGFDVVPGLTITQAQAEVLLRADIAHAVTVVQHAITVQLTQGQFDALVDFTFNVGAGNFLKSTLLKDVNESSFSAAADQFLLWVNAGGRRVDGLVRRRTGERAEFLAE